MTNETEQLRRLVDARERATKGPWENTAHLGPTGHGGIAICSSRQDYTVACVYLQISNTQWKWDEQCYQPENAEALGTSEFIALSGTTDLRSILTRMEKMEEALRHIEWLKNRADELDDLFDYPHTWVLRMAAKTAKEALK